MSLPAIPVRGGIVPCIEKACSACCHDIEMILTEDDLARIRAAKPDLDFFFQADDGYLQLRTRDGPPATGGQGRPCTFLSPEGRCTIHEIRPEGCRLYPAVWVVEARKAELDDLYCPHTDGFLLPTSTQDATRKLAQRLMDERKRRVA